ncbi:12070_t:CDS:2, partial [Racocetra persica]
PSLLMSRVVKSGYLSMQGNDENLYKAFLVERVEYEAELEIKAWIDIKEKDPD